MSDNVIKLYPEILYYASCPQCGSTDWKVLLNNIADDWTQIMGTQCSDCEFTIDWVAAYREEIN